MSIHRTTPGKPFACNHPLPRRRPVFAFSHSDVDQQCLQYPQGRRCARHSSLRPFITSSPTPIASNALRPPIATSADSTRRSTKL